MLIVVVPVVRIDSTLGVPLTVTAEVSVYWILLGVDVVEPSLVVPCT